jgi:hypothetical protein
MGGKSMLAALGCIAGSGMEASIMIGYSERRVSMNRLACGDLRALQGEPAAINTPQPGASKA